MKPIALDSLRLETPRLVLRSPRMEDFDAWAAFMSDEETMKYIGGVQPRSGAWRGLMTMAGAWALTGVSMFSVIEKSSGKWIGRLGPWRPEGWPDNEVGWGIAREHWGKGYASEGAAATMDYAFDVLGWPSLIHTVDVNNAASKGVARKLGSTFLRSVHLPPPFDQTPVEAWGQTREQWRGNGVRPHFLENGA